MQNTIIFHVFAGGVSYAGTTPISGGADIHNSFLGQGLVDEVIFNVAPVLEGRGLNLLIDRDNNRFKQVQLLDCKPLGGGVIQLHYSIDRAVS